MFKSTLFVVVGALILAGCSSQSSDQANASNTNQPAPAASSGAGAPQAASKVPLGVKQEGDHFAITLATEPAQPKVGEAKFVAKILHHGKPFSDATVKVDTIMPGMGMGGPSFELQNTTGDTYEGSAKLPMGGDYEAKVVVTMTTDPDHTDTFTYKFSVSQ